MGRRKKGETNDTNWNVGLYIRLSKETRKNDDSDSVINQRVMLTSALEKLKATHPLETFNLIDIYIDDGETGTDSERENFQRILDDIKNGIVNLIMFKDLSRLGRNYSEAGFYLDSYFVKHNTRYICLSAPYIDSKLTPDVANSPLVPIQNVFNDDFARTTSLKIRAVFKAKKEAGQFIGAFAPYGYKKDSQDKNKLIIDDEAAAVVRDIYRWFADEGLSKKAVTLKLNQAGIPNPSLYKRQKGFKYCNPASARPGSSQIWMTKTVSEILQNEMYIGNMVQGKQRVKSYKVHERVTIDESEWTIVEGTHEPIIEKALFDKAQALHQKDTRVKADNQSLHMFAGFVRCKDCLKAMKRAAGKKQVYFVCRTHYESKTCTRRSISERKLNEIVLCAVQTQIQLVRDMEEIVRQINSAPIKFSESARLKRLLDERERELQKCQKRKTDLYENLKDEIISKAEYLKLRKSFESQEVELGEIIAGLIKEKNVIANGVSEEHPYLQAFLKYQNVTELSRPLVIDLVNNVYVSEDGGVELEFKCKDQFHSIAEFVELNSLGEMQKIG